MRIEPEIAEEVEQHPTVTGSRPADNQLTDKIIGAAIEVHRTLGPGLLESAYVQCLCHELSLRGLTFVRELPLHIGYKGISLESAYRVDLLVEDAVVVEVKAVERMLPVFDAQLLTY